MSIFTPRLDYTGTDTLDYYTTANPFYTMYDYGTIPPEYLWMPNCVAYAFGRWNELAQEHNLNSRWPIGNGVDWWYDAPGLGLSTGSIPQLGAAMVWGYFNDDPIQGQPGHVAIVEKYIKDSNGNITDIICSNSAFNSYQPPRYPQNDFPWWYWTQFDINNLNYDKHYTSTVGTFMGFVYHPNFPAGPEPLQIGQLAALLALDENLGNIYIQRKGEKRR